MPKYIANWTVSHDGKEYPAGKSIVIDDDAQAAALLDAGAISEAAKEPKPSKADEAKAAAEAKPAAEAKSG